MFSVFKKSSVPSHVGHAEAHAGSCCGGGHAREHAQEEHVRESEVSGAPEAERAPSDEPVVAGHHRHG